MLLLSHLFLLIGWSALVSVMSWTLTWYWINQDISVVVSALIMMSIVSYIIASAEKKITKNHVMSLIVPLVPLLEKWLEKARQEQKEKPKKTLTEEHKQKIREATAKRKRVNGKFV